MGSLSSAKTLGGVGGILVFIPFLSLVGWILILLATKEISDSVQDKTIFDDALLAGITAVIGAVVFAFVFALAVFTGSVAGRFVPGPFAFSGLFLGVLAAFWVFTVISAIFLKRSYEKISQRLNVSAFATTGLLYLIGAALTIVVVGFLIILIALIFQVVAYFSIQDRPPSPGWGQPAPQTFAPSPMPQQPTTQQQSPVESKFCSKCGAKLPSVAVFCTSCGAKQS
jgi:uncharacterized membrane protein/ribosomal protein L40E